MKIKFTFLLIAFAACQIGFVYGDLPEPRYESEITFSGYNLGETLTNFPALVVLSTNISGFSYADFVSPENGADLRFTSTNRSKILNYEIESWDTNGISRVWVQIDKLASNTSIYAMWGNASWSTSPAYTTNGATWNADYEAVWHLSEVVTSGATTADAYKDSTSNHRDGDQVGNSNIDGPVGRAQYFDGSNDYINVAETITSKADLTIAAWLKIDGPANWDAVINHNGWSAGNVHYQFPLAETSLDYDIGNSWHVDFDSFTFNTGQWYHVVAAYDRSAGGSLGTITLYVDGDLKQSVGGLNTFYNPSPTPGHIGSWGLERYFKGAMDEFRILNSAPSSNWFRAAWLTAASNDQFSSYGEVQHEIITPIHYVSPVGGNISPYTNWANAAHTIQDAIDVASPGDTVLVTNGTYSVGETVMPGFALSNRVVITKNITVNSVNGPENTIILGQGPNGSGAVRGVCMTAGILEGFTVSNGHTRTSGVYYDTSGGGVNMMIGNGIITNCTISGNSADDWGGGTCGGTYGGTVNNCTISGNSAYEGGGSYGCTVNNSTISGNSAEYGGGTSRGTVNNSTISGNSAYHGGGTQGGIINNSTISGNSADRGGGTYESTINNCTICGNSADNGGGGTYESTINNCIVWDNTASSDANFYDSTISYSCSTPLPSGVGNISSDPQFVNASAGDYHLLFTSSCIDAGSNGYVQGATDLDGNPRILNGTVDMGCYEVSRNYLFSAPAIVAPISVLSGDMKSFFTMDSQVVITGSKITGYFVGLETEQGGFETNGISQILSENSWQQIVTLNNTAKIMSYFTCSSNISEVSMSKTTLEITKVLLEIATNALIFPSADAELLEGDFTNIIWDVEKITDDIDGTNLTITKISVHLSETTNEVATVTNGISNLLREIPWIVPNLDQYLIWTPNESPQKSRFGSNRGTFPLGVQAEYSSYVLKFEVVDSSSLTNSRIFWDNKFSIIPEPGAFGAINSCLLLVLGIGRKFKSLI